jgi:hypothetical protein
MRTWRSLPVLAAVALALGVPATAALAAPYPAPPTQVTVSDGTVSPGEPIVFSATGGFIAGETIRITIRYLSSAARPLAGRDASGHSTRLVLVGLPERAAAALTTTADSNGGFSVNVTLTAAGTARLTATGLTSDRSVSRIVTVLGGDGGPLAVTGDSGLRLAVPVGAGAIALFLGGLLVWLVADRRRRRLKV